LIESERFAANVSLAHPLAARRDSERRRLNLELGVLYARDGAIRGAAMSLGYQRVDGEVNGYSAALFWNRSGPVLGLQLSGIGSEGYGPLHGIGYANIVNLRSGDVWGVQAAGLVTRAGDIFGVEGAAAVAIGRDVRGAELGVIAVGRDVVGAQLSLVGVARDVHGVQASIVGVGRDVRGVQGGLVNVARRVNGLQIGLVNLAEEVHGGALGLVSIAGNGRLQPTLWLPGPEQAPMAGVKSVTDFTYSELGFGYDPWKERVRYEASLGLHLALTPMFYGEAGFGYAESDKAGGGLVRQELRYEGRVGYEVVHGLTPFIGGALTQRLAGGGAGVRAEYSFGIALL
jgi:hypothetical protein